MRLDDAVGNLSVSPVGFVDAVGATTALRIHGPAADLVLMPEHFHFTGSDVLALVGVDTSVRRDLFGAGVISPHSVV